MFKYNKTRILEEEAGRYRDRGANMVVISSPLPLGEVLHNS
jgi:hypothetical protein